jgi:nucleoside-diphosphate kinase
MAKEHYKEHVDKPFYVGLEKFITEGPVVGMVIEGNDAIEVVRKIVGPTEPKAAQPGTIRGDFSHISYKFADNKNIAVKNLIHASANQEDAEREISLWFAPEQIHDYENVFEKTL